MKTVCPPAGNIGWWIASVGDELVIFKLELMVLPEVVLWSGMWLLLSWKNAWYSHPASTRPSHLHIQHLQWLLLGEWKFNWRRVMLQSKVKWLKWRHELRPLWTFHSVINSWFSAIFRKVRSSPYYSITADNSNIVIFKSLVFLIMGLLEWMKLSLLPVSTAYSGPGVNFCFPLKKTD